MPEPDYKEDLYFEPKTVKSNLDKIESAINDIKENLKQLPVGQIRNDLTESAINDLTPFEIKIKIWKEVLK